MTPNWRRSVKLGARNALANPATEFTISADGDVAGSAQPCMAHNAELRPGSETQFAM
jgi:hypothetical protein